MFHKRFLTIALVVTLGLGAVGCSGKGEANGPTDLRLGYFPNVTHAPAIAGVEKGFFSAELGADIHFTTSTFNAGPSAVEALLSGAIDAAYLGPNPAINAFSKSKGAVRLISGATAGGAALVVSPDINVPADLKGKRIATPSLANTQDVALRTWLASHDLKTNAQGGGDVHVVPQENAQTLQTFQSGDIDGAWVPEPWTSRLVKEGNGKVLVDERTLWPNGQFATTILVVRTDYQSKHPDIVKRLIKGHIAATDFVSSNTTEGQTIVNSGIGKITGKQLATETIVEAWKSLTFTNDPISSSLTTGAVNAERLGLLDKVELTGLVDLTILNDVLREKNRKEITAT